MDLYKSILNLAQDVRAELMAKYENNSQGHCIEASEEIVKRLQNELNIESITVEGWCKFDDEYYGSDCPWDPHTWVEIPSLNLYVDVTADQFNYGMFLENEFPGVVVQKGLPKGMQYEEPSWSDFGYDEEVENKTVLKPSLNKLIDVAAEQSVGRKHLEDLVDLPAQYKQNSEAVRKVMDFITDER